MTASTEHQLVIFTLHDEQYALPVELVAEIVRYTPPTATAAATDLVRGLINLRGRILPIVDLSARLGRELTVGGATRILVVDLRRGAVGLIVDRVGGIVTVPAAQVEPLPVPGRENGLSDSVAVVGDGLVLLLDAERALGPALPARRTRSRSSRAAPGPST